MREKNVYKYLLQWFRCFIFFFLFQWCHTYYVRFISCFPPRYSPYFFVRERTLAFVCMCSLLGLQLSAPPTPSLRFSAKLDGFLKEFYLPLNGWPLDYRNSLSSVFFLTPADAARQ